MVDVSEDSVFGDNVIDLLELDDVCLLENLHSKVLASLLVSAQAHSAERTYSSSKGDCLPVPRVVVIS
jgi:hypothetical protein